jgi:GAF domain-containing protein
MDADGPIDLGERVAEVVRALHAESGVQDTVDRAVSVATETVRGCDHASVSLVHQDGTMETLAATSEVCRRGDALQYELQEGPCVDAAGSYDTVRSADLSQETRWPSWSARAVRELGVRSVLSFRLYTAADELGALNLYSDHVDAFDDEAEGVGFALAAHVAVAMAGERNLDYANMALVNRTVIGQAEGILMERYQMSADQAFRVLARVSQQENVKLRDIAGYVVRNRQVPGVPTD